MIHAKTHPTLDVEGCFGCPVLDVPVRIARRKRCSRCGQVKAVDRFYKRGGGRPGYQSHCISCHQARTQAPVVRRWRLRQFGATEEWYESTLAAQGGGCSICGAQTYAPNDSRRLAVDHDHVTDRLRGLLCQSCNRSLGGFKDDPSLLRRAADYLEGL